MNRYSHFANRGGDIIRPGVEFDPNKWRLLRRLCATDKFSDQQNAANRRTVVVDVETIGLSTENDDVGDAEKWLHQTWLDKISSDDNKN